VTPPAFWLQFRFGVLRAGGLFIRPLQHAGV
jgi:hypothetical protein